MSPISLLSAIKRLVNAGTAKVDEAQAPALRILNTLSLLTGFMVFAFGMLFYGLVKSKLLLYGVIFEGSVFFSLIYITEWLASTKITAFCMLAIHSFSAIYFGALLGMAINTNVVGFFLLVFLVLGSYFIFRDLRIMAANLLVTVFLLAVTAYNNHYHIIRPIQLDHTNLYIFRWFSIFGMLVLTLTVSSDFIRMVNNLLIRMREADANRRKYLVETSHELKSPLSAIITLASNNIHDKNLDDRTVKLLESIIDAATHGLKVVNNVQEVAKIEAGRPSEIVKVSFELKRFMASIYNMMVLSARNKGQELHISYASNQVPRRVTTDETMLRQIMLNLISNAVKYAPVNSPLRIYVDFECHANTLLISVANQGIAFENDRVGELFTSFVSTDYTATGGSGLGLEISRKFARRLGGDILLQAGSPGEEITFVVKIPVVANEKLLPSASPVITATRQDAVISGKKILLIDDEDINFKSQHHLFRKCANYYAREGTSGLRMARDIRPDLILLDAELNAAQSGKDILLYIKSTDALKHIPVIIVTATSFKECQEEFMEMGASAVLTKPLGMSAMKVFADILQQAAAHQANNNG
ncbi:hybrid sensor histidine kinase/response regulator [Chitinophaga sp. Cy-1792]|uniref:ATP-binding response regulator n=1 Tax=Chitinophaga sp. Cy-1792 TaxID=2608339 RepID=UPI001422F145|nr:hybrid sensor histidine kinase/response regulator [Chitinophaga sp. Cy-1792]NIG56648.1 hybrid sensor histidine kinase/response regulator [Chitinophaga sp. Cy-1792]